MKNLKLYLAPMEGVVDWVMRDTLTQIGGIDHCVTEFVRVIDKVYPDHYFYKNCPELKTGSKTRAGTPVFVQILGGQAEPMAMNAARAVELGAAGIDINFGCPAKTVNRHDGGAAILRSCARVHEITSAVRKAVPAEVPVTVKIRLGFEDRSACLDISEGVAEAGAAWMTVHCRTKTDGYTPPAYWEWIPRIKERAPNLKIVANGEIWNVEDFNRCREVTSCEDFMIGRGVLSDPFIFRKIKKQEMVLTPEWTSTRTLLNPFYEASAFYKDEMFAVNRTKQWLRCLSLKNNDAKEFFNEIKLVLQPKEFKQKLEQIQ